MEYVWKSSLWIAIFQRLLSDQEYYWPTIYRAGAAVVSTISSKRDIEACSSSFYDLTVVLSKLELLHSVLDHIFREWKPWKENAQGYISEKADATEKPTAPL